MQILIKEEPSISFRADQQYKDTLQSLAGKWVEVETKCLFDDQYNIEHLRVFEENVEEVRDDARIGKMKCTCCGECQPIQIQCRNCCDFKVYKPHIFPQNRNVRFFIIRSESEHGFWHNALGWVSKAMNASRFTLDKLRWDHLPNADLVDVLPLKGFANLSYE